MSHHSAIEAISPAIERTKVFLFRPFQLGRFLKLTLVALLTEGGMASCNFNSGFPSGKPGGEMPPLQFPPLHLPALAVVMTVVAVVLAIAIPIGILIGYLFIRLRFSFFDCVLYAQDEIAAGWQRHHRQAMRYLGMTLCVTLAGWLILIPVGYSIYEHFKPLFQSMASAHPPKLWDFLPVFATILPLILAMTLIAYLVQTTLGCFALPRMAIEDASIRDALEDVWSDMRMEPGQFALFFLFRVLLSIASTILAFLILGIPLILVVLLGVAIGLILKGMSGVAAVAFGIPAAILVGILFVGASIGVSGTIGTFRRNYALLFYAGRYPRLAAILWPPPAPVAGAPQTGPL